MISKLKTFKSSSKEDLFNWEEESKKQAALVKKTSIEGVVAIIGRPNVGKSTLFNCLTRSKQAIVDDQPGVTRDRIYGQCFFDEDQTKGFSVVDTGGFETDDFMFQPFKENLVWKQTKTAIEESDLIVLLFDGLSGVHQYDHKLLHYCKSLNKPMICAVNKIDGDEKIHYLWQFYELGLTQPLSISSAHNKGIRTLKEAIKTHLDLLPKKKSSICFADATKIALIGKPNVGKSSLLNRIVGEERSLVSEVAGTTRDSIDTPLTYNKENFVLIDTAGMRRRTKVSEALEVQSVIRSLRAIEEADIVIVVIEALYGITDQDAKLINLAAARFKPIMIVVNKWDLVPDKDANTAKNYAKNIHNIFLKDLAYIPIHFVSCLQNQRVFQILGKAQALKQQANKKVATSKLNEILRKAVDTHTPQLIKAHNKRIKFYYATQVRKDPPTIVVMCNVSDEIQESYKRYLLNQFRRDLGFKDVPVRVIYRGKKEAANRKLERNLENRMAQLS